MVRPAIEAAHCLRTQGIRVAVVDMYCVKPIDKATVLETAAQANAIITVEEHSPFGGLGSMVSQIVAEYCPKPVKNLALPDAPVITGTSKEVFEHYGLDAIGIASAAKELLKR